MKLWLKYYRIIVLVLLSLSGVVSYFATIYAYKGTYHYGPFIIGPVLVFDGLRNYKRSLSKSKFDYVSLIQILFGGFIFSEHVYLYQVFLKGLINF